MNEEQTEDLWHVVINFHVGSKYVLKKSWHGLMDLSIYPTIAEKYNVGVCGFAERYMEDVIKANLYKTNNKSWVDGMGFDYSVITFAPTAARVANVTVNNIYSPSMPPDELPPPWE